MRWRLIVEEFSQQLIYIKCTKNISADALSHLDKKDDLNNNNSNKTNKVEPTLESLSENFALKKEDILHPSVLKKMNVLFKLLRKSLKTIPLNNFMGQVRRALLSMDTEKI